MGSLVINQRFLIYGDDLLTGSELISAVSPSASIILMKFMIFLYFFSYLVKSLIVSYGKAGVDWFK